MKVYWSSNQLEEKVSIALDILKDYFEIYESKEHQNVCFSKMDKTGLLIKSKNGKYTIFYSSLNFALRGINRILTSPEHFSQDYQEYTHLKNFRVMIDNSRNAVMTLERMKEFIANSAMLGYTTVSPYIEDIYEIPEYPAFGYLRGAFKKAELKEMNDFGKLLGVQLVASIQTLGHLQQIFHYKYFDNVKDSVSNLLVGEEKTYDLIDKMLKTISECFESKEICLGMDEVHSLGKGAHLSKYGYEEQNVIFNRHIKQVSEIAKKYGYNEPVVWSDMFIKMFSKNHDYRDDTVIIPDDFSDEIADVKLGYWDYDSVDQKFVEKMIDIHQRLHKPFVLVTGLTTWFTPCYKHWKTKKVLDVFEEVTRTKNIDDFYLTIWGDDGAYCDPDSYYIGMFYLAERVYTKNVEKDKYQYLFGNSYDDILKCSEIDYKYNGEGSEIRDKTRYVSFATAFYDDPFYAIGYNNELRFDKDVLIRTQKHYEKLSITLYELRGQKILFDYCYLSSEICRLKLRSRINLLEGYFNHNYALIEQVIQDYQELKKYFIQLDIIFEQMWLKNFKTYGLDVMKTRFAGYVSRFDFLIRYLGKYLKEEIKFIDELEESKKELNAIRIKDFYSNLGVITIVR